MTDLKNPLSASLLHDWRFEIGLAILVHQSKGAHTKRLADLSLSSFNHLSFAFSCLFLLCLLVHHLLLLLVLLQNLLLSSLLLSHKPLQLVEAAFQVEQLQVFSSSQPQGVDLRQALLKKALYSPALSPQQF